MSNDPVRKFYGIENLIDIFKRFYSESTNWLFDEPYLLNADFINPYLLTYSNTSHRISRPFQPRKPQADKVPTQYSRETNERRFHSHSKSTNDTLPIEKLSIDTDTKPHAYQGRRPVVLSAECNDTEILEAVESEKLTLNNTETVSVIHNNDLNSLEKNPIITETLVLIDSNPISEAAIIETNNHASYQNSTTTTDSTQAFTDITTVTNIMSDITLVPTTLNKASSFNCPSHPSDVKILVSDIDKRDRKKTNDKTLGHSLKTNENENNSKRIQINKRTKINVKSNKSQNKESSCSVSSTESSASRDIISTTNTHAKINNIIPDAHQEVQPFSSIIEEQQLEQSKLASQHLSNKKTKKQPQSNPKVRQTWCIESTDNDITIKKDGEIFSNKGKKGKVNQEKIVKTPSNSGFKNNKKDDSDFWDEAIKKTKDRL